MLASKLAKAPTKALDAPAGKTALERGRALKQLDILGGHHPPETHWAARQAPHPPWDFSKIPLFSSERPTDRPARAPMQPAPRQTRLKLAARESNPSLEHEADRVAEQVTRPDAFTGVDAQNLRFAPATAQLGTAGASVGGLGGGAPLDPLFRARMEPRFGHDFSGVRVHTGTEADRSARSLGAQFYGCLKGAGQLLGGSRWQNFHIRFDSST